MKKGEEQEEEYWRSRAMQLASSSVLPMVMQTINDLGVLEIMSKEAAGAGVSAEEIASKLELTGDMTTATSRLDRMLCLLAAHSILTCTSANTSPDADDQRSIKSTRLFGLAPIAKHFIPNSDGISLGPFMSIFHEKAFMKSWPELKSAVIEGSIPFNKVHGMHAFEYPEKDPGFNQVFNKAMISHTTIVMSKILDEYKGFDSLHCVVDVGGGLGVTLKLITSKYPQIKGINFDLIHVIKHAPLYPGVENVAGDMFESVPRGDAIFMKWILHDWDDDHCLKLLKNCYNALPENGKVIIVEGLLPEIPDAAPTTQWLCQHDVMMMTQNPGGRERTQLEFLSLATTAGFAGIRLECSVSNLWVMEFYNSVLEEEDERGVAHIVEHLAFSATEKYSNHDLVKFLESIGAGFGACQNAVTSADETVYELFVPVDKPELLSQAISVLAEFSSEVRVSVDDLEKERGAVMEEYRANRNATGRMHEAHWILMMEGSKYAERFPIGLEKVIRTVPAESVKQFYKKWYHLHSMAVIAIGDFPDTQNVVELIRTHFGDKNSEIHRPSIPKFPVQIHEEPRISCYIDAEASGSAVMISCKMPVDELKTLKDYRNLVAQSMFISALNRRFYKITHRKDPPYFSCFASTDILVRHVKAYIMSSSCKGGGTVEALESMLVEISRVRLHGFSEREISVVRALTISEMESLFLERDQMQSTIPRDEYLQHFLSDEPVLGVEYEAQLRKTIVPHISAYEVSKYGDNFKTSCGCVITLIEPRANVSVDEIKILVSKINHLEEERSIPPWNDENIPEEIVAVKPNPGHIVQQNEHLNIGATELILSNGMRVCFKCTDFLDDQVLFTGFTYGGLSELPESEYFSCSMGPTIAGEIGLFGYKPSVLVDMLAGRRAGVGPQLGTYMRSFHGDCSPADLEIALQLVYQLFTTDVKPGDEEVKLVMQMAEEGVLAQERDPYTAFTNRVREIKYGNSYFFRPTRINDLKGVDPFKACDYFNNCFKDPSTFTVVIVGKINPAITCPLILQYLGGIPRPPEPILNFNRDNLKGLPFTFPSTVIRELVHSPMIEAQCLVQLCFPIELKNEDMLEGIHFVGFLSKLIESKILQFLRFKHGRIYSACVSVFLGGNRPSRAADARGDVTVNFSCDPDSSTTLVDLALDEILRLQKEGPSVEDISAILEIEQRAHENGLQENTYWLEWILRGYQSRIYSGDVGTSFEVQNGARSKVRKSLTPLTAQLALQRILPFPCKKQYTVVILLPLTSTLEFLRSLAHSVVNHCNRDAKILGSIAGLTILALSLWRCSRSALRS